MEYYIITLFQDAVNAMLEITYISLLVLSAMLFLYIIKAPKKYVKVLLMIPFIWLLNPIDINSHLCLLAKDNKIFNSSESMLDNPCMYVKEPVLNKVNTNLLAHNTIDLDEGIFQIVISRVSVIWIVVAALLLGYCFFSYLFLKHKIKIACACKRDIYFVDAIDTPFVFGVFKPAIYLPSKVKSENLKYIIAHEQVHLKKRDYIIKLIAFILTCFYWFNPVLWIVFLLLSKYIELSCDEEVIRGEDLNFRKEYAKTLLLLSSEDRNCIQVPLAFFEGNTKKRVQHILQYKKRVLFISVLSIIVVVGLAIGLLTSPVELSYLEPSDIKNIVKAEVSFGGNRYTIKDKKRLQKLEDFLSKPSREIEGGAGCPFEHPLFLQLKNGKGGVVYPATDSCRVYRTASGYYEYNSQDNSEFWGLFGIDISTIL